MFERVREDINCVFARDPAARNAFEVLSAYPGVHAVLLHRAAHGLWNRGFKWAARMLASFSRWLTGIEIHPAARIGRRLFIDHGMGVVIGETAEIDDDCTLYHGVTLGGTSWKAGKRHPSLGKDVVVGAGAKVLGPLRVGDGARIGSNAVVVKDVPAGATVVGIPGRVVNKARDERRQAFARRIGFDAYGTAEDMPDPVANAIDSMLDHIHAMDEQMRVMCTALKRSGIQVTDVELPGLEPCEINHPDAGEPAAYTEESEAKQKLEESSAQPPQARKS